MSKKLVVSLLSWGLLLAACGPQVTPVVTQPVPTTVPTTQPTTVPTDVPTTIPVTQPEPTGTPIHVDLTPAQLAAMQALAQQLQIPVEQITLVSTEAVDWPDGCLGVVLPNVSCLQAITPGFRIIFSVNGQAYEYHTNQDGSGVIAAQANSPFVSMAVQAPDGSVQIVKLALENNLSQLPVNTGLLPQGGNVSGTVYALTYGTQPGAVAVTENGTTPLDFIQRPTYGLAVWAGDAGNGPKLAWGTQIDPATSESQIIVSAPDGSQMETLLQETGTIPSNFVAQRWSADGQTLFFSREPSGIGGYIPFAGASSLYALNVQDKSVTEIIPFKTEGGSFLCLDAISLDNRYLGDHCGQTSVAVRDLSNGQTNIIQPPAGVTDFRLMGSARFSPNGQRVAFALAKGDPSAEQTWIAVSDSLSGASQLVLAGEPGQSVSVVGWLDDATLLLQRSSLDCTNGCSTELWQVNTDGGNLLKIADGTFITAVAIS